MEPKVHPKKDKRPQPRVGMLVVAYREPRKSDPHAATDSAYVKQVKAARAENTLRTIPVYDWYQASWEARPYMRTTGNVEEGTFGIVVKGNGGGMFFVAFGGKTAWAMASDIAEEAWAERQKAHPR